MNDSISAVLSYMLPILIISASPNIIQLIPSEFVRRNKDITILPQSETPSNVRYSFDMSTLVCYRSGTFWQNTLLFIILYIFATILLQPLDPTMTQFIRSDIIARQTSIAMDSPQSFDLDETQKKLSASMNVLSNIKIDSLTQILGSSSYHIVTALLIIISCISITGMPKPYNNVQNMFNNGIFLSVFLPIGKLLIDFKYRTQYMDFYGSFFDVIGTIVRILLPLYVIKNIDSIRAFLSFLIHFNSDTPLPTWALFTIIILLCVVFTMVLRTLHPRSLTDTNEETEMKLEDLE